MVYISYMGYVQFFFTYIHIYKYTYMSIYKSIY